jgi:hypothetical protein
VRQRHATAKLAAMDVDQFERAAAELDALLALLGVAPLFVGGSGGEIACAVLGVIAVLIAGSIQ